jgi:hypothetical protein
MGRLDGRLTGVLVGLVGQADSEGRRAFSRGRGRLGCRLPLRLRIAWPGHGQHDAAPKEPPQPYLGEQELRYHGSAPSHKMMKGALLPRFQPIGISRTLEVHDPEKSKEYII